MGKQRETTREDSRSPQPLIMSWKHVRERIDTFCLRSRDLQMCGHSHKFASYLMMTVMPMYRGGNPWSVWRTEFW